MKKKKSTKERWVWNCEFDNWTWADGYRCPAQSKKPVATEKDARKGLEKHCRSCTIEGKHWGTVRRLEKGERWKQ